MGVLGHSIEEAGIATTQISLIREHTEAIKPPRALWVPFELGRPFGMPGDEDFQKRVLRRVLGLLEAESGPVLEDYPEEAPQEEAGPEPFACPVSFAPAARDAPGSTEGLLDAFQQEASQLRTWYDLALQSHARSTVGVSGFSPEESVALIVDFIRGLEDNGIQADQDSATTLRLAVQDLKAYYLEAVAAQPGRQGTKTELEDWFWGQTAAAGVLNELRRVCMQSTDQGLQFLGKLMIIPQSRLSRFEKQG